MVDSFLVVDQPNRMGRCDWHGRYLSGRNEKRTRRPLEQHARATNQTMTTTTTTTTTTEIATTTTTTLLLIDVQNDFHPGGSLAIPTAHEDAARIAALIRQNARNIHRIVATLDSHPKLHIAHPCFWWSGDEKEKEEEEGQQQQQQQQRQPQPRRHPDPFTILSADDVRKGIWKPRSDLQFLQLPPSQGGVTIDPTVFAASATNICNENGQLLDIQQYCIEYCTRLEERGRFQLCIWPEHCLIGSPGHAIVNDIRAALNEWSDQTGRSVEWVMKGQHPLTEMYSAIAADVPVSTETAFNVALTTSLLTPGTRLLVAGQAMSHCVNYTMRDLVSIWKQNASTMDHRTSATATTDLILLIDCASAVPGCSAAAAQFVADMQAEGVKLWTAAQAFE